MTEDVHFFLNCKFVCMGMIEAETVSAGYMYTR